jgi:hypothetical protein
LSVAAENTDRQIGCTMTASSWRIFSTFSIATLRLVTSRMALATSRALSNSGLA